MPTPVITPFVRIHRARFTAADDAIRLVYSSELVSEAGNHRLALAIAERVPLFYRDSRHVIERIQDGYFTTAFKEALRRLPTAESFQEYQNGEIDAALFAQEVLGLDLLYSKLSFLSSQNSNAYKMDLVLCDFAKEPLEFVLGEVKSSMKCADTDSPPYHRDSCYSSIFRSLASYTDEDVEFDLTAAEERLGDFPPDRRQRVHAALLPYGSRTMRYAAFAVIDLSTRTDDEVRMLATRAHEKTFEVDLLCIEMLPEVVRSSWEYLNGIRRALDGE